MPDAINVNDSELTVRIKIIAILDYCGISTDDINTWGTAAARLNLAASLLGLEYIQNGMAGGEARERINAIAASPAPALPANTVAPTITGIPEYGQLLSATAGTWTGYPTPTYAYQWKADGTNISGATANTYTLTANELGKVITVQVTANNLSGSVSATSAATAIVTSEPINSSAPTITGTVANGQVLTASNGTWIAYPTPTYTYQWKADGVNIASATANTYTLQNAQVGKAITVAVTATNTEGAATQTSSATALATSAPINTVVPAVAAEAVEGKILTATTGTWVAYPTPTYTYQWKRNGVNIGGATASTYTVVTADIGTDINVTVTATNTSGNASANSVTQFAKPAWAEGSSSWRNYLSNLGNTPTATDVHAATIWAPDASQVYSSFAPNTLVRNNLGIHTVPTRTNTVQNPTALGAAAGVPGTQPNEWSTSGTGTGITREVIGRMTVNGLDGYAVKYSGTASSTFDIQIDPMVPTAGTAAVAGETWTLSAYLQLLNGTAPTGMVVMIVERSAANASLQFDTQGVTITPTLTRVQNSHTLTDPSTAKVSFAIRVSVANGAAVNFTVFIGCPMLEKAAFAGSPIQALATVGGNQPTIKFPAASLDTGIAGFLVADILEPGSNFVNILRIYQETDLSDRLLLFYASGKLIFEARAANVASASIDIGNWPTGPCAVVFMATQDYFRARIVGQADIAADTSGAYPAGLDTLAFGGQGNSSGANTYQRSKLVSIYNTGPFNAARFNTIYANAQLALASL